MRPQVNLHMLPPIQQNSLLASETSIGQFFDFCYNLHSGFFENFQIMEESPWVLGTFLFPNFRCWSDIQNFLQRIPYQQILTSLEFFQKLELSNRYGCCQVNVLKEHLKRPNKYWQIWTSFVKIQIDGIFWFKKNLNQINYNIKDDERWGITKTTTTNDKMATNINKGVKKAHWKHQGC
jgi:hypothetical protein